MANEKRPQLSTRLLLPVLRLRGSGVRETFQVLVIGQGLACLSDRGRNSESTYGPSPSCTTLRSGRPIDSPHVDHLHLYYFTH